MQNLDRRDHSKCVPGVIVYLLWHSVVRNRVSVRTAYLFKTLLWTCWVHDESVLRCTAVYRVVATLYIVNFMLYNNMLHQWTTVYISEQHCESLSSIVHRSAALCIVGQHCTSLDSIAHRWAALYNVEQHCHHTVHCWTALYIVG